MNNFTIGAIAVLGFGLYIAAKPSSQPAFEPGTYAIVIERAIGCGGHNNECVSFREGERLIVDGWNPRSSSARVRRIGEALSYSMPGYKLAPERAE